MDPVYVECASLQGNGSHRTIKTKNMDELSQSGEKVLRQALDGFSKSTTEAIHHAIDGPSLSSNED